MDQVGTAVARPLGQVARAQGIDGKSLVHFFLARIDGRKGGGVYYEVRLPFAANLEHPLAIGNVELVQIESEDVVMRGGTEQLDDFPTQLAPGTRDKHPHFKGSHHQRLSRYQAKVLSSASSRSCSGCQPMARTFSEATL